MNFIAATVQITESITEEPIKAYGLNYRGAYGTIPSGNANGDVRFRVLCYDNAGPKLQAFIDWETTKGRALITGNLVFSDDPAVPLDLIVSTIEPNIPNDMYCNQVVLGLHSLGLMKLKSVSLAS